MRPAILFTAFLLTIPMSATASPDGEPVGETEPKAQGMIYATVQVAEDFKAEFLDGPHSGLPDDIVEKVAPSLMAKARKAHITTPAEDNTYRVAIDWNIVSVDGEDQMKFGYSNSEPYPLKMIEPVFTRTNATRPVEIVYRIDVSADGSVTSVSRAGENTGNADLYHAGLRALKQWKFSPQYKEGLAVATNIDFPLVFDLTADTAVNGPHSHGL